MIEGQGEKQEDSTLHMAHFGFSTDADGMPDRKEKHKVVEQKRREKVRARLFSCPSLKRRVHSITSSIGKIRRKAEKFLNRYSSHPKASLA